MRDWNAPQSISRYITLLNEIRRRHPALQRLRNLTLVETNDPSVVSFAKVEGDDMVLVLIDMRPSYERTLRVSPVAGPNLTRHTVWRDELDGSEWTGDVTTLGPDHPARILTPVRPDEVSL